MAVSTPIPDELLEKHLTETRFDAHRELIRHLTEGLREEQKRNDRDHAILFVQLVFVAVVLFALSLVVMFG